MSPILVPFLVLLVAIIGLVPKLMARFQGLPKALERTTGLLEKQLGQDRAAVVIWRAHPLSEEHIKHLAESRGFRYVGVDARGTRNSLTLRFVADEENRTNE
ncbi:hypothetical protein [Prauserella rugosa]|uniref:Uncharacterized protein n=1 Tax=Prauserella rugosa TaxID=43354 RepID=A0A660CHU3_9PSEU|nr:hypothetical protein [Prauserella rugosa]KMS82237.1 hypothetical protein ACZ91_59665 [Streptomyces regensis]TWH21129.1 hypothetical protein JD82_02983 [Prauserella rugosa]